MDIQGNLPGMTSKAMIYILFLLLIGPGWGQDKNDVKRASDLAAPVLLTVGGKAIMWHFRTPSHRPAPVVVSPAPNRPEIPSV